MTPRILMFGWEFPPYHSGGLGTACAGLTRALSSVGASIIFVLPKNRLAQADYMRKFVYAGVEDLVVKEVPALLYPYVTVGEYRDLANSIMGELYGSTLLAEVRAYAERARSIAETEDYEVIHAHDWLAFPAGVMAKAASGKPLVVHVHATEFDRTGNGAVNPAVFAIEREGMIAADRVIAVSQWTKDIIVNKYGIPEEKVAVVHNGVESIAAAGGPAAALEQLRRAGNKIVLFVGRVTLQKGPDYFVELARRVLAWRPQTYFVMVGSGDMLPRMIERAADHQISNHFIFPGFLRGEELNSVYRSADLYILPSVSEPFGITPLEAAACGAPVMVSRQSGVSEVMAHALKVDFWDIDEMTNQVLAVLDHPSLAATLADNGRRDTERTTWLVAANKCLDIYRALA